MSDINAVLSYTRKDDDFFGGYITAFRKTLENAVIVVTGRENFYIFQDVEGIVIGEQWEKKLADVIKEADFLVPMLSPLFFNSQPCRDEVDLFVAHEKKLNRNDLILPIYFLTSAKLEKEEEKAKDTVAVEISKRQMFDWRENANLSLKESEARQAILSLANAIANAIERLPSRSPVVALDESRAAKTNLSKRYGEVKREKPSEQVILWVDDRPENNLWERHALESYGVRFVLATNTAVAQDLLRDSYAAIISDFGRPGDSRAGYTLLRRVRSAGIQTPYFIYSGRGDSRFVRAATSQGAQGATNDPDKLVAMVLQAIR